MSNQARVVFMFSGQGSHYFHMAAEARQRNTVFRRWLDALDAEASALVGESIVARIYDSTKSRADRFDRTLHTHPAIFMVQYALAQTLLERGVVADVVWGSSLGELTAAAVAGAVDWRDGLALVVAQARAVEQCCAPGGMIAVLEPPELYERSELRDRLTLVSVSFDRHFVMSGDAESLRFAEGFLRARNATFQVLAVSQAFHSASMDSAADVFRRVAARIPLMRPRIPLASCLTTRVHDALGADHMWDVARRPIDLRGALATLEAGGPNVYVDVGAAGTMANLVKYALPRHSTSTTHGLLSAFGGDVRELDRVSALLGAS